MKNIKKILKISQSIIFSIIITIIPLANSVSATNSFYSGNDILFYDENANVASCTSTGGGTILEKVWSYFINKGLNEIQTAGIMGNFMQESDISPTAWQTTENDLSYIKNSRSDKHAWGIAQWDGDRRYNSTTNSDGTISEYGVIGALLSKKPNLAKYLDSSYSISGAVMKGSNKDGWTLTDESPIVNSNIPEADLNELLTFELDFTWEEFPDNGYDEFLANSSTIIDAAVSFNKYFERSSDEKENGLEWVKERRGGYATAIYNKMKGMSPSSGCSTGNRFIDTLKSYAWPTHKGWYETEGSSVKNIEAITPTDGYKNAIIKAASEGRYTGDACSILGVGSGIDCGAFVTTFIYDSGWDTNYNYGGKGGATSTQKQWLDANWQNLGNASKIDTSTLQPGDVAIYSIVNAEGHAEGHTFVYIGNVDGFETNVASASQCNRAPMSGKESLTDKEYTWYRKK